MGLFKLWIKAICSGAPLPIQKLYEMKRKGVRLDRVISSYIRAKKCSIDMSIDMLMLHDLANGNVHNVVKALIIASRLSEAADYKKFASADLAGKNIVEEMQSKANRPETILAFLEGEGEQKNQAFFPEAGTQIPPAYIFAMYLRGSDMKTLLQCWKEAQKSGNPIPIDILEAHHLGGGDVSKVVEAFITSVKANKPISLYKLFAMDIAGIDVIKATQKFVKVS